MVQGNCDQIDHASTRPLSLSAKPAWRRNRYFLAWAKARGIVWNSVTAHVEIKQLRLWPDACFLKASVPERLVYHVKPAANAWFGLRVSIYVPWTEQAKGRKISEDECYPAANGTSIPPGRPIDRLGPEPLRRRAVNYAGTFCGAAPGYRCETHISRPSATSRPSFLKRCLRMDFLKCQAGITTPRLRRIAIILRRFYRQALDPR